jgi:hypothetical protein
MGLTDRSLFESDETLMEQAFNWSHPRLQGITIERLNRETTVRLNVPAELGAFRRGEFPHHLRQVRVPFGDGEGGGTRPPSPLRPPARGPRQQSHAGEDVSPRLHLAARSSLPELHVRRSARVRAPRRRGARADHSPGRRTRPRHRDGEMVRTFNDRGEFLAKARVWDGARPGVVVGLSVWWAKLCPGARTPTP